MYWYGHRDLRRGRAGAAAAGCRVAVGKAGVPREILKWTSYENPKRPHHAVKGCLRTVRAFRGRDSKCVEVELWLLVAKFLLLVSFFIYSFLISLFRSSSGVFSVFFSR